MQNGYYLVKLKSGSSPDDFDVVMVDTGVVFIFLKEHSCLVEDFLKTYTVVKKIKLQSEQKTSITGGGYGIS